VKVRKPYRFRTTEKKYDFPEVADGAQCFRWVRIEELTEEEVTFPIDKFLLKKIKKELI